MAARGGFVGAAPTCRGAPRDAGFTQGVVWGAALRRRYGAEGVFRRLRHRAGWSGPEAASLARDLRRHYPHQAEVLAAIARGSHLPRAWLESVLAWELLAEPAGLADTAVARAAGRALGRGPTASFLALRVGPDVVVRRSRPEGCFGSIDVTLPWFSAALVGVNEGGLGVVCVPEAGAPGACRAPAALLVQDCLERFDALEAALDWCLARPAGGRATLLLGDAQGEVAGVEVAGEERRVLRPSEGVLVAAGARGGESEIAKSLRDDTPPDLAGLERALGGAEPATVLVVADPADRRLGWLRRGTTPVSASGPGPAVVQWFPV